MKAKIDYAFLIILAAFITGTTIDVLTSDYVFTLTNYFGFAAWLIVLILRVTNNKFGRRSIALLLILGTLNIFNFLLGVTWMSIFGFIQFNPIVFLLLVAYYMVNKTAINPTLSIFFKGSLQDQEVKHQKMVHFYINQFKDLDKPEFEEIFKNLNAYPEEAQVALKQIRNQ